MRKREIRNDEALLMCLDIESTVVPVGQAQDDLAGRTEERHEMEVAINSHK